MSNIFPTEIKDRIEFFKDWAQALVTEADEAGLVITITLQSPAPLAMRNYVPVIEVREKR